MKQTCSVLSTYAADVSGVCSALYEMGGMTVMHDPSGCNSTYNTHDEPRWYDMPSMVYLSALYETEAMLGDESRVINDICRAAEELSPRFIAIAGTVIP
ncbi:MAG: oxidoreductase, partial [Synergistaceae bacterium]|nr:oxidoreductase [Synergistaceae bacterium]